jgi:hypothetical protein
MIRLVEWFFSLFIDKSKMYIIKKEAAKELGREYLEYQNKVYFNKLSKNATKKRL